MHAVDKDMLHHFTSLFQFPRVILLYLGLLGVGNITTLVPKETWDPWFVVKEKDIEMANRTGET